MFFIFGRRWTTRPVARFEAPCGKCQRPTPHTFFVQECKVTLFFVPLIPMPARFPMACGICGKRSTARGELRRQLAAQWKTERPPAQRTPTAAGNPTSGHAA
jgi:hypothetical protein